jgi:hypothetical protein
MTYFCPDCKRPMMWEIDRVSDMAMLSTKCRHCDPAGPWTQEPVEVLRKPRGKRPDHIPQPPD